MQITINHTTKQREVVSYFLSNAQYYLARLMKALEFAIHSTDTLIFLILFTDSTIDFIKVCKRVENPGNNGTTQDSPVIDIYFAFKKSWDTRKEKNMYV